MDTGTGQLAPQVIGETEALQQFFSGHDMSGMLDSSVAVDTSILEQYLSADMDPSNFMLPESPPDSSSESCSPAQIPDFHYESSYWSKPAVSPSGHFNDPSSIPPHAGPLTHDQLRCLGFTKTYIKTAAPSAPPAHSQRSPDSKKRRRSESDTSVSDGAGTRGSAQGSYQMLSWEQYIPEQWCSLHDSSFQTLPPPIYHVDTDKGFSYSPADEVFICQKKNHFQVTVHIGVAAEPQFVTTPSGPQQIHHFQIKVFGVKLETNHLVTIEQSQPDRSKKPFQPIRLSLPARQITKVTLGRLHFSETTANNIRKKGKPNPDQRYFQMVVGLYAVVREETFLLTALVSERIIVRASNPGQFETDSDAMWQRGAVQDSVVYQGSVGINTDSPDEALVVCGNAKVMGNILQPSDSRAKHNIQEADSEQQLKRINQMRIVEFNYRPEFASTVGIDEDHQTGVIAQEVKELLPRAVKQAGDITCSDGETIKNLLMVDKEQIFMENVGAVQQLSKITDNLETRIKELEVWNQQLAKLRTLRGSLRSTGKPQRHSIVPTTSNHDSCKTEKVQKSGPGGTEGSGGLKHRHKMQYKILQASIFTLLATMAFSVISITSLYLLNLKEESSVGFPGHSNGSSVPQLSTVWPTTVSVTSAPSLWPPEVDFCDLLYCDTVYCCPSQASNEISISSSKTDITVCSTDHENIYEQLLRAKDWTNTTIHTFMIKENGQVIDGKYCLRDECGPGRFVFRVPISQFVSLNMRVTLLMNSTELLVVHLCSFDETLSCSSLVDFTSVTDSRYPSNTQGEHAWPLHVASLHQSSYHFRSAVAGLADCSTEHHYGGVLFTDYHFHFYRRCLD
ncbi:myelin regulatory factor-like protein [Salarias fasciatus]|uniref:myelin regulatory factor-like protein n=1 Tax=Salarias fasciatus TaxID=181472 RepID=UPI001176D410|nr:myelin regulatory factor-like protein [Salarias fasciatus]